MPEKSDSQKHESPLLPLSPKNQALKDRLAFFSAKLSKAEQVELYNKELVPRTKYLRENYPDWERREVYHIVAGSGLLSSKGLDFYIPDDFPGKDSIEAFIKKLEVGSI